MAVALAPAQAAAQQPTVQQQFEAGSAALHAGNWAEALRLFEALEARVSNPRTLAITRIRKALALIELNRFEEAEAALRIALPDVPEDDSSLLADRFDGMLTLARLSENRLDYAEAERRYRAAAALPVAESDRIGVYRGLIQTRLFDDPAGAVRAADEALAAARAVAPDNRELEGAFHTLKGRALLNLGRFREARDELEIALRNLGNLTLTVNRADLLARSDLALAALLTGDERNARRYLAYTGAGRSGRDAIRPAQAEPPMCREGLAPQDVAVIQFAILNDGTVGHVMPIYASRPGPSALIFARAVAGWTFERDELTEISPMLRSVSRVEIRCTNVVPSAPFVRMTGNPPDWRTGLPRAAGETNALRSQPAPTLRQELARREAAAGAESGELVDVLVAMVYHEDVPIAETADILRRILSIVAREEAAPQFIARMAHELASLQQRQRDPPAQFGSPNYEEQLSLPAVRNSPLATAALRLVQAHNLYREGEDDRGLALTGELLAMPHVQREESLRLEALELTVALHGAKEDMTAARAAYEAMGQGARRCGLAPRQRRASATSRDFPNEALAWGFEGWAASETVVAAGGQTLETRTVAAYPPFVFGEAARNIMSRARLESTYIPDDEPCVRRMPDVIFRMAD